MDGTRDRLPERTVETWGRSSARRAARRMNAQPDGPARPLFAAAAPVCAPDVLIDVGAQSVPAPASEASAPVPAAEPARDLAKAVPAPARVRRPTPLRAVIPAALGALGLVAAFAAAMLLRSQLAPDAAAVAATAPSAAATAEPAAAAAIVHLRVSQALDPAERQRIAAALAQAGYRQVIVHEMPFSISTSRVGYFREDDRVSAEALLGALSSMVEGLELRDYGALVQVPEPGRLDLWIRS
jgi:hypothetical protein